MATPERAAGDLTASTSISPAPIVVRRDAEIYATDGGWFQARWHFSFDQYRDPENMGIGTLRVFNHDTLVPGAIWPMHPHRDIEGITYVVAGAFEDSTLSVSVGSTWTTDAPFRETAFAIKQARAAHILAVEMEAAALYAFAQARNKPVICFAHVTNRMGNIAGDFEKGEGEGSRDALHVISATARAWLSQVESTFTGSVTALQDGDRARVRGRTRIPTQEREGIDKH